jgi:hypothetical protein
MSPDRLRDVADRCDLDPDARADLVRAARRYDVVPMLERWPAEVGLVETAEAVHGADPSLVVYCAAQGWLVMAREMAARLRPGDVRSVPYLWERQIGAVIPDDVRLALLDALMVQRERPTGFAGMTDREQDEVMKRIEAEDRRREQAIWDLLEPVPHLWTGHRGEGARCGQSWVEVEADLGQERQVGAQPGQGDDLVDRVAAAAVVADEDQAVAGRLDRGEAEGGEHVDVPGVEGCLRALAECSAGGELVGVAATERVHAEASPDDPQGVGVGVGGSEVGEAGQLLIATAALPVTGHYLDTGPMLAMGLTLRPSVIAGLLLEETDRPPGRLR